MEDRADYKLETTISISRFLFISISLNVGKILKWGQEIIAEFNPAISISIPTQIVDEN